MEELTFDLNHALDEAAKTQMERKDNEDEDGDDETPDMGHGIVDRHTKDYNPSHVRRKSWRRRCKSTSNLTSLAALVSNSKKEGQENNNSNNNNGTNNNNNNNNASSTDSNEPGQCHLTSSHVYPKLVESKKKAAAAFTSSSESELADDDDTTIDNLVSNKNKASLKEEEEDVAIRQDPNRQSGQASGSCTGAVRRKKGGNLTSGPSIACKRSHPLELPSAVMGASPLYCSSDANLPPPKLRAASGSVKRKRKFKRMAIDPTMSGQQATSDDTNSMDFSNSRQTSTLKRSKMIRPRGLPASIPSSSTATTSASSVNPVNSSSSGAMPFFVGKRKRSAREKLNSDQPEAMMTLTNSRQVGSSYSLSSRSFPSSSKMRKANNSYDNYQEPNNAPMELEDDEDISSSSISSSEWEADDQDEKDTNDQLDPGREADDEQSDWPGAESVVRPLNSTTMTNSVSAAAANSSHDDWDDDDDHMATESRLSTLFSSLVRTSEDSMTPLTSTARQAYMARMRQLADCVPGREIRAGSRRLANRRQEGFTIRSSSSEQLARFLHDPNRTELRLNVLRASDRDQIEHLAKLYALSVRRPQQSYEGAAPTLVLSKTAKTLFLKELAVHQPAGGLAEFKRRRCTPPNSPLTSSNDMPDVPMSRTAAQLQSLLLKERAKERHEANSDHGGHQSMGHNKSASAAGSAST